jgi:colanic acid biosynthesis glycosyl transferase WcaI
MTSPVAAQSPQAPASLRIAVLCPHFAPDTAPTGEVITRIVTELAARGHQLHVVTSLPWYRSHAIEPGWEGRLTRRQAVPWGSITRVHPFPGKDKRNLFRRAAGFAAFSVLAGFGALPGGRVDAVIAMSPPLTLGLTGWFTHLFRRGPLVFNIQDVFPDAAIRTGAITDRRVIAVARWVERISYRASAAVTVLSDDLAANVAAKLPAAQRHKVHVIPNFVDVEAIVPRYRLTAWRAEQGIGDEPVVMYAGNVGFSQSLEMVVDAARRFPKATFVINGDGAARAALEQRAAGAPNVRFTGYQPRDRLGEVLASADVHLVPLRAGLGSVSVPSKTYSVLAAGRPALAAIDAGTEVPRLLDASGGGVAVAPDDPVAFAGALGALLADPSAAAEMGAAGRRWVVTAASPAAVAESYERLITSLRSRRRGRDRRRRR